jgi:hypothetical protein
VTSLSGPKVTSLSGVYTKHSRNQRLWNGYAGSRGPSMRPPPRIAPIEGRGVVSGRNQKM